MEKKVLIMLATYNGERFIEQQIESILKQTYTNFHLAIQDDGSTDATLDIIKKYSQKDKRIEILKRVYRRQGNEKSFAESDHRIYSYLFVYRHVFI